MLDAKLVIVGGADSALEYELKLPTSIGRGTENDISLAHPLVSRRHCELFEEDGLLFVKDNGSLNGTYLNRQRIDEAPLVDGDEVQVGKFKLVFLSGRSA